MSRRYIGSATDKGDGTRLESERLTFFIVILINPFIKRSTTTSTFTTINVTGKSVRKGDTETYASFQGVLRTSLFWDKSQSIYLRSQIRLTKLILLIGEF